MSDIIDSYSESNYTGGAYAFNPDITNGIKASQSFVGDGKILDIVKFHLKKTGSPTGNAVAKLYVHSGTFGTDSLPTGSPLATSENFDVSSLLTSPSVQLETFTFTGANKIKLRSGVNYVVVLEHTGDTSNHISAGIDHSSPTHVGNSGRYYSSVWSAKAFDMIFYVYGNYFFTNKAKNSTALTNKSKESTALTNRARESTALTNKAKVSTSLTNKAKVSTSLTNRLK